MNPELRMQGCFPYEICIDRGIILFQDLPEMRGALFPRNEGEVVGEVGRDPEGLGLG